MGPREQLAKERKAACQRRYYQSYLRPRNKDCEQQKGRIRASKYRNSKRSKAKQQAGSPRNSAVAAPSCITPPSTPPPPESVSPCDVIPALPSSPTSVSPSPTQSPDRSPSASPTTQPPWDPDSLEQPVGVPGEIYIWWPSWSARRRISGIRRWVLDVEWREGEFTTWTGSLMNSWDGHRTESKEDVKEWADDYARKARIGRLILQYLGRVMDGQLTGLGVAAGELALQEECRDLSLQIHQIGAPIAAAVAGLEVSAMPTPSEYYTFIPDLHSDGTYPKAASLPSEQPGAFGWAHVYKPRTVDITIRTSLNFPPFVRISPPSYAWPLESVLVLNV
ncbi:hypothetical protein HWV62_5189 [Athelia sp. TMB]|nr:hypothetical protein HWV62_5189 [Athelia sp. TMB]